MFLNSRRFCRNSLTLRDLPRVSGLPCCLWILSWETISTKNGIHGIPIIALSSLATQCLAKTKVESHEFTTPR